MKYDTLFWPHAYPIAINFTSAIVVWETTQWPAGIFPRQWPAGIFPRQWPAGIFPCYADSTL
jgi:hypothetical protein